MIYIKSFANYDEFKEVFGITEHGNGVKSRKNKILLGCLKDREFFHRAATSEDYSWALKIKTMDALKDNAKRILTWAWSFRPNEFNRLTPLESWSLSSSQYKLDELRGLCEDGDSRAIRYVNTENNRVFKMKAGKFLGKTMEESNYTRIFPEQLKRWLCEEFAREWQAFASVRLSGVNDKYELHVDDNFAGIYNARGECAEGFGSCMSARGQWTFYRDAIDAKAAYITDKSGRIAARCIIYTNVQDVDDSSKTYRLAERQYAAGEDNVIKQILINKLIAGGFIDGYKRVGVSCHANDEFVSIDGEDWRDKDFFIENRIQNKGTLSYQDSFIYLDYDKSIAFNHSDHDHTDLLNDTCHTFHTSWHDENSHYSSWYDCYINDEEAAYDDYNNDWGYDCNSESYLTGDSTNYDEYATNSDRDDFPHDFVWSECWNSYIVRDDAEYCRDEHDWYFSDEVVYLEGGNTAPKCNCVEIDCVWYRKTDCVELPSGELWPETDAWEIDGVWYKDEDVEYSQYHGTVIPLEKAFHSIITDDWYLTEVEMQEDEEHAVQQQETAYAV